MRPVSEVWGGWSAGFKVQEENRLGPKFRDVKMTFFSFSFSLSLWAGLLRNTVKPAHQGPFSSCVECRLLSFRGPVAGIYSSSHRGAAEGAVRGSRDGDGGRPQAGPRGRRLGTRPVERPAGRAPPPHPLLPPVPAGRADHRAVQAVDRSVAFDACHQPQH